MPNRAAIARIFSMEWSRMLQYRFDLALWVLSEAMTPLVSLAIWYTVASTSAAGPTPREVLTYYVLIIFVVIVTQAWGGFFLAREILEGDIVQYLIRPLSIFWKHIANNLTEKVLKLLIPLPLLLAALILFRDHFAPAIYESRHIILFAISLILAVILAFVFDMASGLLAFWLEDVIQIRRYTILIHSIASGILIPFAFMPAFLQTVFGFLPFRYMLSFPLELLLGQVPAEQAIWLFGYQVLWIGLSIVALITLWRQGLKRYAIPGQ